MVLAEQQRVQREQVVDLLRRELAGSSTSHELIACASAPISADAAPGISDARNAKWPGPVDDEPGGALRDRADQAG